MHDVIVRLFASVLVIAAATTSVTPGSAGEGMLQRNAAGQSHRWEGFYLDPRVGKDDLGRRYHYGLTVQADGTVVHTKEYVNGVAEIVVPYGETDPCLVVVTDSSARHGMYVEYRKSGDTITAIPLSTDFVLLLKTFIRTPGTSKAGALALERVQKCGTVKRGA